MKKLYFMGTITILALSIVFIGYGVYLNSTSNSYIETMLELRAVSLSGVKVSRRELHPQLYIDYIGLRTRNQADVITEIDGLIEQLYVHQGQEIKRGDPICKIVNKDVPLAISRANTDVAKAEAAYLQSMSTVERNRRLASEDAIPSSELEMSISQLKAAKAEFDAAQISRRQTQQQMTSQTVVSPLSGSVIMLYQQAGNFISRGTPVAMVADFSKMYFTVLVDDKEVRNIAPTEGKFALYTDLSNMTEKAFDSAARSSFTEDTAFDVSISSVLPPFSESVPARSVTFEVDNRLGVMEMGMYTDIVIQKETPKSVLAVPSAAVFDIDGPKVYVRGADSRLALRGIRTGVNDDEYVEVAEGLEEGDVVITSGVEGLSLGVRVEVNVGAADAGEGL